MRVNAGIDLHRKQLCAGDGIAGRPAGDWLAGGLDGELRPVLTTGAEIIDELCTGNWPSCAPTVAETRTSCLTISGYLIGTYPPGLARDSMWLASPT